MPPNNNANNYPLHRQQYALTQQQFVSNSSSTNARNMPIDSKSNIQRQLQQQHQVPSAGFPNQGSTMNNRTAMSTSNYHQTGLPNNSTMMYNNNNKMKALTNNNNGRLPSLNYVSHGIAGNNIEKKTTTKFNTGALKKVNFNATSQNSRSLSNLRPTPPKTTKTTKWSKKEVGNIFA